VLTLNRKVDECKPLARDPHGIRPMSEVLAERAADLEAQGVGVEGVGSAPAVDQSYEGLQALLYTSGYWVSAISALGA
jgi:hypothetical protein